jgi:SAM-dependent methyltransferase
MSDTVDSRIERHYARSHLEAAILDALADSGKDAAHPTPDDLSPVDEFHTGGHEATVEFASRAGFPAGAHLIDLGCGIGGPSRFFARQGHRVTGIDLTQDYVATAAALSRRVGLDDRVDYQHASALSLPFADGSFDGAYLMHVGMNIPEKPRLFSEVHRVLRQSSIFAIYDVMRVGEGELRYPLHWASSAETSFVAPPSLYESGLIDAGFDILHMRDRREFARGLFRKMAAQAELPPLGTHLLMKSAVAEKIRNYAAALEGGVIAPVEIISRAR